MREKSFYPRIKYQLSLSGVQEYSIRAFHTLCLQEANSTERLCICPSTSVHSLLADVISKFRVSTHIIHLLDVCFFSLLFYLRILEMNRYFFCGSFMFFLSCVCYAFVCVCALVVTCWERADLLALVCCV